MDEEEKELLASLFRGKVANVLRSMGDLNSFGVLKDPGFLFGEPDHQHEFFRELDEIRDRWTRLLKLL